VNTRRLLCEELFYVLSEKNLSENPIGVCANTGFSICFAISFD